MVGEPSAHPIKPLGHTANDGFVGVLGETEGGKPLIKLSDGFAQLASCLGQEHKIIHVAHIVYVLLRKIRIHLGEMEGAHQGAKGTPAGNAFFRGVKDAAQIDGVMHVLGE